METNLERLYKYSRLFSVCKEEIRYLYERNTWKIIKNWNDFSADFLELYSEWERIDQCSAGEYLETLHSIKNNINNSSVCAEIIENRLLPQLYNYVSLIDMPEVACGNCTVKKTKTGFYSLRFCDNTFYSIDDPLWEAKVCVDSYFIPSKQSCYIFGAELGYFAYAIYEKYHCAIDIYIFDYSETNIEIAYKYGVLDWIDREKLHIVVDTKIESLLDKYITIVEESEDILYYISPSYINVADADIRVMLRGLSENFNLLRNYRDLYLINFLQNKKRPYTQFEEFAERINKVTEKAIIVAAGPSLNGYMDYLREQKETSYIIAVSTAVKKIISNGIIPDLNVLIDPTEGTYNHINGILDETSGIPLLYESQAYWKFVADYKGERIRFLGGDLKHVADEASMGGEENWGIMPTVTCYAIQAAIRLGVKEIVLVGCDLAYPDGKSYVYSETCDAVSSLEVMATNGEMVPSTDTFVAFRKAIEEQIEKYNNVKFYNLSTRGALIKGCFCGNWWEDNNDYLNYLNKLSEETRLSYDEKYFLVWQIIYKYINSGTDNKIFWELVYKNMSKLHEEFDKQLIKPETITTKTDFIILLTSQFSMFDEGISRQILDDAHKLVYGKNKNVLIINTGEYMGGKAVPVCDCQLRNDLSELEDKEYIYSMGERYAYSQLTGDTPSIECANRLIQFFCKTAPELVINYDELSLMADAFKEISSVEHR